MTPMLPSNDRTPPPRYDGWSTVTVKLQDVPRALVNDRGIWLESTAYRNVKVAQQTKLDMLQGANARLQGTVNAARKTLSERHDEVQKAVSEARQKAATAEALKCAAESRASSQKTKRLEADAEIAKLTDERDVAQATEAATRTKLAALEV